MKRDYKLFITDIISSMDDIEEFIGDMDVEQLKKDKKTSNAIIRKFEIMGEAAKNVPDEIKNKFSNIPWKSITGMRDRLIHAYFEVDYNLVWSAVKSDIPIFKPKLKKVLKEFEHKTANTK